MAYAAVYQRPGFKCSGGARPGLVRLAEAILGDPLPPVPPDRKAGSIQYGKWPESFNLGTYNCRPVAGVLSKRLSAHGEGRALDVGFLVGDPKGHPSGWALAHRLVAARDEIGLSYVVWAGQSWRAGRGWKGYTGRNKHFDHVHFEITHEAADNLTADEAVRAVGPPTVGGHAMTPEQEAKLDRLLAHWEDPVAPAPLQEGSPAWMFHDWNDMFRNPARGVVAKATVSADAVADKLIAWLRR